MASKSGYICSECGYTNKKWLGKCPNCESWGTFEEEVDIKKTLSKISAEDVEIVKLEEIELGKEFRMVTKFSEFDRVLGGGLVKGEVVLISGNPGIGKSTFLLQLTDEYSKIGNVFYISGEESLRQIKQRADRLRVKSKSLYLANETNLEKIESIILKDNPKIVVIDSIQTLYSENVNSIPGSMTQIRETTLKIIEIAKSREISFFIVGHITKDGKVAGPKMLEHMVDAVIQIEGEENSFYRIIRTLKNRFGSTNEISIFDMKEDGISEITNPSEFFIGEREEKNIGSIITPILEG
ncbi:MAG: DNA repair protein RadA, partial [Fusobacteriales bacterium]|nr:DNA repair protein RadA [Fusobacteriales bacterium]